VRAGRASGETLSAGAQVLGGVTIIEFAGAAYDEIFKDRK